MLPFNIGLPELILILAIALIIFGPGKLPEVGKSLGRTIREFRKSSQEVTEEVQEAVEVKKELQAGGSGTEQKAANEESGEKPS